MVKESGLKDLELAAKAGRLSREAIGHIVTGKKLTVEKAVEKFLEWMESVGRAPKHIKNIRNTVNMWMTDVPVGNLPPSAVTEKHINPWINNAKATTKVGTRNVKLSHLRELFEYCTVKGWSIGNPARLVRVRYDILSHEQKETTEKEVFTPMEVKRIATDCHKRGDLFWEFATRISEEIGLRLGDVCQLEWTCFKKPGHIIVWTDRRDRQIAVPVSEKILAMLEEIPSTSAQYLFPHQCEVIREVDKRTRLSMQYKRLCARLGMPSKSFHNLRHTCITRWAKEGKSLESIGKDVGHAETGTTKGYVH